MFNDGTSSVVFASPTGANRLSGYGATKLVAVESKPIDKLFYPKEIAGDIGMCKQRIAFLKHKGCRFIGRKTTIRWVREFLNGLASVAVSSAQL
jgi:hypothetical protein